MTRTIRVTMFKIPDPKNIQEILALYRILSKEAVKDGKPYILSLHAGPAMVREARGQGYTLVGKSEFSCLEDMQYYDTRCPAHQKFKTIGKEFGVEGVLTVYYQPEVVNVLED